MSQPIHGPWPLGRLARAGRLLAAALLASASLACSLAGGRLALEARSGQVRERGTGVGVAGAEVYQAHWRRGVVGEPRSVAHLRWTRSDAEGRFRFEAGEARVEHLPDGPAEYGFYHAEFGLVRGGPAASEGELVLSGQRLDEEGRRAARLAICSVRPPDRIVAELARRRCGRPPDRQE